MGWWGEGPKSSSDEKENDSGFATKEFCASQPPQNEIERPYCVSCEIRNPIVSSRLSKVAFDVWQSKGCTVRQEKEHLGIKNQPSQVPTDRIYILSLGFCIFCLVLRHLRASYGVDKLHLRTSYEIDDTKGSPTATYPLIRARPQASGEIAGLEWRRLPVSCIFPMGKT